MQLASFNIETRLENALSLGCHHRGTALGDGWGIKGCYVPDAVECPRPMAATHWRDSAAKK